MVTLIALLVGIALASIEGPGVSAQSALAERGGLLYENHCTGCHESVVHVREDRKVRSRQDLLAFITRWHNELGLGWSAEEMDDVLEYLNERYYGL